MRRLTFRGLRARTSDERGAVGVMVALMLVPLLGFAAIAIDLSALRAEQQQLRNGADAAALAVATDCAWNPTTCGGDTATTANSLVVRNAGQVGASTPTSTVAVAPTNPAGQTVTVTATARQKHWFAPLLGHDSSEVAATSSAAWTGMSRATAQLPLAIARCEYDKHRSRPAVSMEAHNNPGCTGSGQTTLRFAWLNTDSGSACRITTQVGAPVTRSSAGNTRMPGACEGRGEHLFGLLGKTVLLPVIETVGGVDRVYGFAAFQVTGYDFDSDKPWSQMSWIEKLVAIIEWLIRYFRGEAHPKGLGIEGHFTTHVELSDVARPTSGPDLGARSVFLTEQR